MFDLELTWDRPAKLNSQQANYRDGSHVLRVRIQPKTDANLPSLPIRMAIALDTSQSMKGEKLQRAKEACLAVVSHLRDPDYLSLAGYSTRVTPLLESLAGGGAAAGFAEGAIADLQARGVTRIDLALDWIEESLLPEKSPPLVGVLITDGHATNAGGTPLDNMTPFIVKARNMKSCGIILCAVGLGDAANFNTSFLTDLSDQGGGAFIYADTPDKLLSDLQNRLKADQEIAIVDAKLHLTLLASGVKATSYCRFRPEYLPLEETRPNELSLGTLRRDYPTDILISLDLPSISFGEPLGSRDIISVELTARGLETPIKKTAAITYTTAYSEAQKVNTEVNRDRQCWEINLYSKEMIDIGNSNPKRTGELLTEIQVTAAKAGELDLASQAAQQLDDLQKTGNLNPDKATGMLRDSRNLGKTD